MPTNDEPTYTELPERAVTAMMSFRPSPETVMQRTAELGEIPVRPRDGDGSTETLHGVTFTHRLVSAPADYESIEWHYVECGEGEPIVFLHGLPDSWYQWHHQMAALSATHRCIAVDLKGYGQSHVGPGDYSHEGAGDQLVAMLETIGVTSFNLVAHDRGTVQADFIVANHPERVLRYGRGEQHLYHFNPKLAPQGEMLLNAPYTGILQDAERFVVSSYGALAVKPVPDEDLRRLVQEFSYEGIAKAVPRYYGSMTMRQEWLVRRQRLLAAWRCPVLIMQGEDSRTQPREFYEDARQHLPNSPDVQVRLIPGGHYWVLESPEETTSAIRRLLAM